MRKQYPTFCRNRFEQPKFGEFDCLNSGVAAYLGGNCRPLTSLHHIVGFPISLVSTYVADKTAKTSAAPEYPRQPRIP